MKALKNCVSPETAHVVEDYPYGFRLRCKIRYWVETTKHGMRWCSQTTNPKKSSEFWNKPKKSTYSNLLVIGPDDKGHIQGATISIAYDDPEKILKFVEDYQDIFPLEAAELVENAKIVAHARLKMKELTGGKNIYDLPREEAKRITTEAMIYGHEQATA